MQLTIESLVPIPLRDKLANNRSAIWQKNIVFQQGEIIFIKAPSGTGKTTLIHILYGLRSDKQGHFRWGNKTDDIIDNNEWSKLRANDIGIVFQDLRLFPELTAWENLEIKRLLTNTVTQQQVLDWMGQLGVAHKREALAKTLSYGEQQRIAIIRALLQPFKWLLMDEPFSHLDKANIQKAASLINEVSRLNKAGIILADLESNSYFNYTQILEL